MLSSPLVVSRAAQDPSLLHTLKNKTSPVVVFVTSTTSKDCVMPRMTTIHN
jgi:hypothetical protein